MHWIDRFRRARDMAAGLAAIAGIAGMAAAEDPPRPNVILIVADDMGYGDVACFGGDIPTPAIDALAAGGARLTSFYVAAPVCTPSRYALLTGRMPHRAQGGLDQVGMFFDPAHRGHGLRPGEMTVAEQVGRAGYRTACIGKWHLGHGEPAHLPTRHGFERFAGVSGGCVDYYTHRYAFLPDWYHGETPVAQEGYATDLLTEAAVRFLDEQEGDAPFLLYLPYTAPHYGKSIEGDPAPGPTMETRLAGVKRLDPESGRLVQPVNTLQAEPDDFAAFAQVSEPKRRHYAAMVKALDDGIARVLEAIERRGLAGNTLVLFMADNGPDVTPSSAGNSGGLRGGKSMLWEGGIRVPAAVRWPGRIEAGAEIDQVISALDVMPTLCALAGAPRPDGPCDGIDLTPVLLEGAAVDRELLWRHGPATAYRRGRWKLVGQAVFDIEADPAEAHDLAEERPEILERLLTGRAELAAAVELPQ
jgi:arylsulfatase A-like enzyme